MNTMLILSHPSLLSAIINAHAVIKNFLDQQNVFSQSEENFVSKKNSCIFALQKRSNYATIFIVQ